MFCGNCGNHLPEQGDFCPFCGQKRPSVAELSPRTENAQEVNSELDLPAGVPVTLSLDTSIGLGYTKSAPLNSEVRRLPKWLIPSLCGAAVLVVLVAVVLGAILKRDGHSGENVSSGKQSSSHSSTAVPAAALPAAPNSEDGLPVPDEGEVLYVGQGAYMDMGYIRVAFLLSADRSTIHHIMIEANNLSGQATQGNVANEFAGVSVTERYNGTYSIAYDYGTDNITLGKSVINSLYFYEDTATAELDYTYVSQEPNVQGNELEIPFGTTRIEFEGQASPVSASEEEAAEESQPTAKDTVFDYDKLKNWSNQEIKAAYGVEGIYYFKPSNPQPMYYIVCTEGIIDPVTGKESAGGYESNYTRHKPVAVETLLRRSGNLQQGGLVLTDDPSLATFALILEFNYDGTGTFTFKDKSKVTQYHGFLNANLLNLVSGHQISTEKKTYATYANESVYTSMLDAAKGKQLYANVPALYANDFDGFWDFVIQQ